ncbi:MAG: AAA family ATPase [Pyrinomonadaceae bacterium]|nr:AAA family ATPase [Pyrinomonadaceae bacterium]
MPTTTVEETEKVETGEKNKSELLLDSLEIKGYRCFEHLTIEKLGRVNLIVGKNNVGKTALLEAVYAYVNRGHFQLLIELLLSRDEAHRGVEQPSNRGVIVNLSFKPLFISSSNAVNNKKTLVIKGRVNNDDEVLYISLPELRTKEGRLTEIGEKLAKNSKMFSEDEGSTVEIKYIKENSGETDLEYYTALDDSWYVEMKRFHRINNELMPVEGLRDNQLLALWDDINKNNLEKSVISAMQLLEKRIIDISFLGVPSGSNNLIPYVEVLNESSKLPIKRFGNGMTRLLGLSLALSSCRDGVLFVDEIECGLHYSVLPDVWKLIFKTAKDLNVQVFATTHSKDCVEAFASAAEESPEDGMLIRLERHGEKIVAKTITEERLAQAVDYDVEVR